MNILDTGFMPNPQGRNDVCATFTIDTPTNPFMLRNIMVPGQEYTLRFWARTEGNLTASISTSGFRFAVDANVWRECGCTFTATNETLSLYFDSVGTYCIYHPQLETGNVATDWNAAPEDVDSTIQGIKIGARNLIRNSDDLIFSSYKFTSGFFDEILESQNGVIEAQEATGIELTVVEPGSHWPNDLTTVFAQYLEQQESILAKQTELLGGDS